jgi:hypothetical protein
LIQFKYVFNERDFDDLYDLEVDSYKMTDLVSDPAYQQVLRQMATRM